MTLLVPSPYERPSLNLRRCLLSAALLLGGSLLPLASRAQSSGSLVLALTPPGGGTGSPLDLALPPDWGVTGLTITGFTPPTIDPPTGGGTGGTGGTGGAGGTGVLTLTPGTDPGSFVLTGTLGDVVVTYGDFSGSFNSLIASGVGTSQVEGHALIGGGMTVSNDINNHLFGLRAGGGEEGSIGSALNEGVIMGQGDGEEESPVVKTVPRSRQWEVFTTVNYGNVRIAPITTQSGVVIDSWAPGVGIERHLSRGFTLGFAASYLTSHQSYTGGMGTLRLEGPALSTYLSYVRRSFWSDLLYSFGTYSMSSTRSPAPGLPQAFGDTATYTNAVQFNTGWNFRFQNNALVTGPFAGIDYLHGAIQSYSETGGGLAALSYGHQTYQSLVTRVGWSATRKFQTHWAAITPQMRLSYERQNLQNNGTSVTLVNLPISAQGGHQSPGQDYMVVGAGVGFEFSPAVNLMLTYQTQIFRDHMQAHFAGLRLNCRF